MDSKIQDTFNKCFKSWCENQEGRHADHIFERINLCHSPIEQQLLVGLYFVPPYFCDLILISDKRESILRGQEMMSPYESFLLVQPQATIGQYRVDFLVTAKFTDEQPPRDVLVIECDGHDFHEKTKEQAARDKRRDRFLTSRGLRVLHFTGSEIHKDAYNCAQEVMDCLYDIWERDAHKDG
jgi:very-short-patch-repair endonuclease